MLRILEGEGIVSVDGSDLKICSPGATVLIEHGRHTEAVLELGEGVECQATCFTPGLP